MKIKDFINRLEEFDPEKSIYVYLINTIVKNRSANSIYAVKDAEGKSIFSDNGGNAQFNIFDDNKLEKVEL